MYKQPPFPSCYSSSLDTLNHLSVSHTYLLISLVFWSSYCLVIRDSAYIHFAFLSKYRIMFIFSALIIPILVARLLTKQSLIAQQLKLHQHHRHCETAVCRVMEYLLHSD